MFKRAARVTLEFDMVLQRPSLRTKLAVIAVVGTVIMATLGVLLIWTARDAKTAIESSQERYRLVASYTRLLHQASILEEQSWHSLQAGPAQGGAEQARVRKRFERALAESTRLAIATGPGHARANAVIRDRAQAVLATYDRFDQIGAELERRSVDQGIEGATAYANVAFAPFTRFSQAVRTEVAAGDAAVSGATARAAQRMHMLVGVAIASLVAGFLLMHLEFKLIFGRLRHGLERLEGGVRDFGAGDLKRRIRLGGMDELGRLSDAFDSMAQELADKQRALEAAKSGLEAAVAERTRELETANAALAEEDERRRRFLADVGHELRTPLTIIRGEAQVALRAVDRGCGDAVSVFGRILEQTQGMGRLVDDLFLIARAEAGGLSLRRSAVELGDLLSRVAQDFDGIAEERQATVTGLPGPPVWADVDADRIRQALAALVDNALRHTRPGVQVELGCRVQDGWAVVEVLDDGPGIQAEDAGELFARFRRGETRGDGSGLGLSVVRALAEAHGGSAEIDARPQGGAVARLRLPLAAALREAG